MLVPIILFALSGLGITTLLGVKIYQLSAGATLPLATKRNAVESKVKNIERIIQTQALIVKNVFYPAVLKRTVAATSVSFREAYLELKTALTVPGHWLDKRTRNLVSLVRGRQHLPNRGEPSSYLRDISKK